MADWDGPFIVNYFQILVSTSFNFSWCVRSAQNLSKHYLGVYLRFWKKNSKMKAMYMFKYVLCYFAIKGLTFIYIKKVLLPFPLLFSFLHETYSFLDRNFLIMISWFKIIIPFAHFFRQCKFHWFDVLYPIFSHFFRMNKALDGNKKQKYSQTFLFYYSA